MPGPRTAGHAGSARGAGRSPRCCASLRLASCRAECRVTGCVDSRNVTGFSGNSQGRRGVTLGTLKPVRGTLATLRPVRGTLVTLTGQTYSAHLESETPLKYCASCDGKTMAASSFNLRRRTEPVSISRPVALVASADWASPRPRGPVPSSVGRPKADNVRECVRVHACVGGCMRECVRMCASASVCVCE